MIRTFLAVQFPDEIKHHIDQSIAPLRERLGGDVVRWVDPSIYHLTLKFFGDIDENKIEAICKVTGELAKDVRPLSIRVGEFGVFPNPRNARVFWVGLDDLTSQLTTLQQGCEEKFEQLGFEQERRKFHPHITVGRIRRGRSKQELSRVTEVIGGFELGHLGEELIETIELVRSDLKPGGPVYSTLTSFELLGDGV